MEGLVCGVAAATPRCTDWSMCKNGRRKPRKGYERKEVRRRTTDANVAETSQRPEIQRGRGGPAFCLGRRHASEMTMPAPLHNAPTQHSALTRARPSATHASTDCRRGCARPEQLVEPSLCARISDPIIPTTFPRFTRADHPPTTTSETPPNLFGFDGARISSNQ